MLDLESKIPEVCRSDDRYSPRALTDFLVNHIGIDGFYGQSDIATIEQVASTRVGGMTDEQWDYARRLIGNALDYEPGRLTSFVDQHSYGEPPNEVIKRVLANLVIRNGVGHLKPDAVSQAVTAYQLDEGFAETCLKYEIGVRLREGVEKLFSCSIRQYPGIPDCTVRRQRVRPEDQERYLETVMDHFQNSDRFSPVTHWNALHDISKHLIDQMYVFLDGLFERSARLPAVQGDRIAFEEQPQRWVQAQADS